MISAQKGHLFFSGGLDLQEADKLKGLNDLLLIQLSDYCFTNSIPLFIEADGARRKSLKAPAPHEPAIPHFCTKVCVVAGLSAIGKPFTDEIVHRAAIFGKLVGIELNEIITWNHLFKYLTHPEGGLKSIPENAEKILFLNQCDQIEDQDQLLEIAIRCRAFYDHVLISSFKQSDKGLFIFAHFGKIAGVLLAAGEAKRFCSPKQLQNWNGKSFIRQIVEKMNLTILEPRFAIVGAYQQLIFNEIHDLNIQLITNDAWQTGQASSVTRAINLVSEDCEAVIFLLVDQPQVTVEMINELIKLYAISRSAIITHQFNGQYRHPVLFSRQTFPYLKEIKGDSGGRQLFSIFDPVTIPIKDPFLAFDIDSPSDLEKFTAMYQDKNSDKGPE